jgi:hypothetical protein
MVLEIQFLAWDWCKNMTGVKPVKGVPALKGIGLRFKAFY